MLTQIGLIALQLATCGLATPVVEARANQMIDPRAPPPATTSSTGTTSAQGKPDYYDGAADDFSQPGSGNTTGGTILDEKLKQGFATRYWMAASGSHGSCGTPQDPCKKYSVALPGYYHNLGVLCKRQQVVELTPAGTSDTIRAVIDNTCPECKPEQLDLSWGTFQHFQKLSAGTIKISWKLVPFGQHLTKFPSQAEISNCLAVTALGDNEGAVENWEKSHPRTGSAASGDTSAGGNGTDYTGSDPVGGDTVGNGAANTAGNT